MAGAGRDKVKHLKLAATVKNVHAQLRKKYRLDPAAFEEVWAEHCHQTSTLDQYAAAMHQLATDIWDRNPQGTRIHWTRDVCHSYYLEGGLQRCLLKEARRQWYKSQHSHSLERADTEPHIIRPLSTDTGPNCSERKHPISMSCEAAGDPAHCDGVSCHCASGRQGEPNTLHHSQDREHMASDNPEHMNIEDRLQPPTTQPSNIVLLDVGSCYNPFQDLPNFLAFAIDISPAVSSVHQCDFLRLDLTDPLISSSPQEGPPEHVLNGLELTDPLVTSSPQDGLPEHFLRDLEDPVVSLPRALFHVVVFSLLLEYLPSPWHRWQCCTKAHGLLREHGLLVIITPDSHSLHKNAPMMKSWKTAIESIGFCRWRYEKLEHLHCMAFRKIRPPVSCEPCEAGPPDMLYIPQDTERDVDDACETLYHGQELQANIDTLQELPGIDCDEL